MRLLTACLGLIVLVAPFARSAEGDGPPHGELQAQRCAPAGVGLGGFDPVSYHRYGGWCAMSLALGSFICPDYENYQFQEGHLYLFETTVFTNGRTLWNQDPDGNRGLADRNYSRVAQ